jgi:CheY-like chemotaxis protein
VPKILVADDNANIQKMVVLAFEDRGIQVVTVGNGEAAVRRIPDLNPDLVLADIFMPVRNGYEVCEFVKKDERFSHIPVILLVGAFDPLDEKEARRVGADGVLKKPFVPPDPLIAMVMSALEKNPRVVAEMAKAREAKEVLPPEPVAKLEIPSRVEPKPLPDFPEPSTPEEAALVYGFGTGRRALDDEKADALAKEPVAATEDQESDDEFDGASTSKDWRRNAMDFEMPAGSANRPAFSSSEDELEPSAMFPSERDVPPTHIRMPDPVDEADPIVGAVAGLTREAEAALPEIIEAFPAAAEQAATAIPEVDDPEPAVQEIAAVAVESTPESSFESKTTHWMDAVSPTHADYPQRDWMNGLSEAPATLEAGNHTEPTSDPEPSVSLAQPAEPIEMHAEESSNSIVETPGVSSSVQLEESDDSFFADEPAASAPTESWFAPAPPVFEPIHDHDPIASPVAVASAPWNSSDEFEKVAADTTPAMRDPDLEQPVGVRVAPEPLLIDEEPHKPSQYGSRAEAVPALHSFFAPASGDPAVEDAAPQEFSTHNETLAPSFESPSADSHERVPTGPPPNREALAEIPFLTPPFGFHPGAQEPTAMDSETVDAVVRRVLEKLEPQLHDLLSQGVLKPLVENLLQRELAKKEK